LSLPHRQGSIQCAHLLGISAEAGTSRVRRCARVDFRPEAEGPHHASSHGAVEAVDAPSASYACPGGRGHGGEGGRRPPGRSASRGGAGHEISKCPESEYHPPWRAVQPGGCPAGPLRSGGACANSKSNRDRTSRARRRSIFHVWCWPGRSWGAVWQIAPAGMKELVGR